MCGPVHFFGTFLLFCGAIFLLVTTISAPVIGDLAILKVTLTNHTNIRNSSVTFGSFGHCILDVPPVTTDQDLCSSKSIKYNPMKIMEEIDHVTYPSASTNVADGLTGVMILHPIACGLAFIALFLALGHGIVNSIFSALVTGLAWILTFVVLVVDLVAFGIVKKHVNEDGSGSSAAFGISMWTLVAAMVVLFISIPFVCMSGRSGSGRNKGSANGNRWGRWGGASGASGNKWGRWGGASGSKWRK